MKNWGNSKYIGLVVLMLSYAMIIASLYVIFSHTLLWANGASATGKIQGTHLVPKDAHQAPHTTSAPASAYTTSFLSSDGKEIVFKTDFSSSFKLYRLGEKVTILYWPNSPENAKILGFMSLYLGPLLSLFMGTVFYLIGTFLFRADKPKWRYIKN